jgi:hypothetical protein
VTKLGLGTASSGGGRDEARDEDERLLETEALADADELALDFVEVALISFKTLILLTLTMTPRMAANGESQGREGAYFVEATDARVSAYSENSDFKDVVADVGGVNIREEFSDDFWGWFEW